MIDRVVTGHLYEAACWYGREVRQESKKVAGRKADEIVSAALRHCLNAAMTIEQSQEFINTKQREYAIDTVRGLQRSVGRAMRFFEIGESDLENITRDLML